MKKKEIHMKKWTLIKTTRLQALEQREKECMDMRALLKHLETTEQEQEQAYEISFDKNYRKRFKIIAKNEDEAMRNAEALYNAGAIVFSEDDCYAFSVDLSGQSKDLKG